METLVTGVLYFLKSSAMSLVFQQILCAVILSVGLVQDESLRVFMICEVNVVLYIKNLLYLDV